MPHLVWDWNGTLLDDFELIVAASSEACLATFGRTVSPEEYRAHFTRPITLFYERFLGHPVTDDEWRRLNDAFHECYGRVQRDAALAADAEEALGLTRKAGWSQSLLSMWEHAELVPLVEELGIDHYFLRIDGQRERTPHGKAEHLHRHLEVVGIHDGSDVLLIGDSVDDAEAAAAVGAACVLLEHGPHPRQQLEACGVPLAPSLLEALRLGGVTDSLERPQG